jgi:AcrR family transcriptional regulator
MTRRESNKTRNREKILAAGRVVFSTTGLDACSIRDVVRESGLSPGSFYNYFGTKEAVFAALVEDLLADVATLIAGLRAEEASAAGFFGNGFNAYIDMLARDPSTLQLIARNMQASRTAFIASQSYQSIQDSVRGFIEDGISSGMIRPVDAAMMTDAITMLSIEMSFSALETGTLDVQAMADFLFDLFINAMRVD